MIQSPGAAEVEDQALGWIIRLNEPDFADWPAFDAWLAQDPVHAEVYGRMAAADREIGRLIGEPSPDLGSAAGQARRQRPAARDSGRGASRLRLAAGVAAAVAAAVVAVVVLIPRSDPYVVVTGAGEHRALVLADGTRIDLNGSTRLTLDRRRPRRAQLDRGEAAFTVAHDERRPFRVTSAGAVLEDVGTVFDVARLGGETRVAVAEGAVLYDPRGAATRLDAGQSLRIRDGKAVLAPVAPDSVASWRQGRLVYDHASVETVAADLSLNLGRTVRASPEVMGRTFTGSIVLRKDPGRVIRTVAALLDVEVARQGDGWLLTAKSSGPR